MKRVTILINLCLLFAVCKAQLPVYQWTKVLEGSGAENSAAICVDAEENVITTGWFSDTVDFDPGVGEFLLIPEDGTDAFIAKLDAEGNFIWAIRIGGDDPGYIEARSVVADDIGNIYITGMFYETIDFDPSPGIYELAAGDYNNMFIAKYSPSGELIWAKQVTSDDMCEGNDIAIDADLNLYITGFFGGTSDFDPDNVGIFEIESESSGFIATDIFILKLNASGEFVWAKNMGGNGGFVSLNSGSAIAVNADGVYTTGSFFGNVDFNPGADDFILDAGAGPIAAAAFVSKLSLDGDFLWAKPFIGDLTIFPTDIAFDGGGNLISTGYFDGTYDFNPDVDLEDLYAYSGFYSSYINKLNASGEFVWNKIFKGSGYDDCTLFSIAVNQTGEIYTTGYFTDITDFNPDGPYDALTPVGLTDAFITKLKSDGSYDWAVNLGGDSTISQGNGIALSQSGSVFSTGTFNKTVDFNISDVDVDYFTAIGANDAYIHKLDFCTGVAELVLFETTCDSYFLNGVEYSASGVYTQELLTVDGCDSLITLNLEVTIVNTDILVTTNLLTAEETDADYQWINCTTNEIIDGAVNQEFAPAIDGNYAVIITTPAGCSDTSECVALVIQDLSERDNHFELIYPNTAVNELIINSETSQNHILFTDIYGRILIDNNFEGQKFEIPVANYLPGTYFLSVASGASQKVFKIVLQ